MKAFSIEELDKLHQEFLKVMSDFANYKLEKEKELVKIESNLLSFTKNDLKINSKA